MEEENSTDLMAAFLAMDALEAQKEAEMAAQATPVTAVADMLKMADETADAAPEEAAEVVAEAPVVEEPVVAEEKAEEAVADEATEVVEATEDNVVSVDPVLKDAVAAVAEIVKNESGALYTMQHFESELTTEQAQDIATTLVEGAATELAGAGATEEEVGFSVISAALFNLTYEEINELQEMEDIVMEREDEIADIAANSSDPELIEAAAAAIEELEGELDTIVQVEEKLINEMEVDFSDITAALAEPEAEPISCEECTAAYVAAIDALTERASSIAVMTDSMADSLA